MNLNLELKRETSGFIDKKEEKYENKNFVVIGNNNLYSFFFRLYIGVSNLSPFIYVPKSFNFVCESKRIERWAS